MAYLQPALDYFTHDMPYERGRCERCVCATSFGTQCKRATCRHQKCCWQHARPENALFPSLTSYEATTDREARADASRRAFHLSRYNRVVDQLRNLYGRVGRTARDRVSQLEALQDAYHDAHKRGEISLPTGLVVAGFQPPPDGLDGVDPLTPDLHRRLVRYWSYHADSDSDSFSNEFSAMSTAELLRAIVRVGDAYCLSCSESPGQNDFVRYWQSRLDAARPVINPWTRAQLLDHELDAILAVARRIRPALPRPVRTPPPNYADSATMRVLTFFANISNEMVPFFRLEIVSRPPGTAVGFVTARSIGTIPDIDATDDQYTSGATTVAHIERLWRHHRLFKVEPESGFLAAFTPSSLSVDLFKDVAYWVVWSDTQMRNVIHMPRLAQLATEVRDAVQDLPS